MTTGTETAEQRLIAAAHRVERALAAEDHADADAEAEYASDQLALAARDLVREVNLAAAAGNRPVGWAGKPVHGAPGSDPAFPSMLSYWCAGCGSEFSSNCGPGDITCPDCDARRCSLCGHWEAAS